MEETRAPGAGARWVDAEVHVDGPLVTSRRPADLPAFNRALIAAVVEAIAADGVAAR